MEGVSGAGKTAVCDELRRRGFHAINGDRELAYEGDPATGEPRDDVTGLAVHDHHIWQEDGEIHRLRPERGHDLLLRRIAQLRTFPRPVRRKVRPDHRRGDAGSTLGSVGRTSGVGEAGQQNVRSSNNCTRPNKTHHRPRRSTRRAASRPSSTTSCGGLTVRVRLDDRGDDHRVIKDERVFSEWVVEQPSGRTGDLLPRVPRSELKHEAPGWHLAMRAGGFSLFRGKPAEQLGLPTLTASPATPSRVKANLRVFGRPFQTFAPPPSGTTALVKLSPK